MAYAEAYMKLRCPTYGTKVNFWNFDLFPYVDGVLREVGLGNYKKRVGWEGLTGTFLIEDLRGLKDEYLEKYGGEGGGREGLFGGNLGWQWVGLCSKISS